MQMATAKMDMYHLHVVTAHLTSLKITECAVSSIKVCGEHD